MKRTKHILQLWVAALLAGCLGLATAYFHLSIDNTPNVITLPDGSEWEVLEYSSSRRAYRVGEGLWIDENYITNKTR